MKSKRLQSFLGMLTTAGLFYLGDCIVVVTSRDHPGVPWYESGIYAAGPFGFFLTAACFLAAVGSLLFGRRR